MLGFWGAISITTGTATLMMPRHFPDYAVWCGEVKPPGHFKAHYDVEEGIVDNIPLCYANMLN